MAEYNFQLRGWHALIGIAALLSFLGIEMGMRVRTVDDGMRNAVRERIFYLNEANFGFVDISKREVHFSLAG